MVKFFSVKLGAPLLDEFLQEFYVDLWTDEQACRSKTGDVQTVSFDTRHYRHNGGLIHFCSAACHTCKQHSLMFPGMTKPMDIFPSFR